MRRQNYLQRCLFLVISLPVCSGIVNTKCDIEENAIQNDLAGDAKASAPKTCFALQQLETGKETQRCFYLLLPDCAKEHESVPLVVDLHDEGKCPIDQSRVSGWKEYALSECFVVAWPLGTTDAEVVDEPCFTMPGGLAVTNKDGAWLGDAPDCCCKKNGKLVTANTTNDVPFLHQMISKAIDIAGRNDIVVNGTSVKFTGYRNGATAAMGFTALHSDLVACLAPFSGQMVTPFAANYTPVPVFSVLDSNSTKEDEEILQDFLAFPLGSGPHILPSPSRVDGLFATANQCGDAKSRSNVATDKLTQTKGVVTGGKFDNCQEPVNFLQPPFAAYKVRDTIQSRAIDLSQPVNRVVDTTGIALLFCKDRQSVRSAYEFSSSASTSHSIGLVSLLSLVVGFMAI